MIVFDLEYTAIEYRWIGGRLGRWIGGRFGRWIGRMKAPIVSSIQWRRNFTTKATFVRFNPWSPICTLLLVCYIHKPNIRVATVVINYGIHVIRHSTSDYAVTSGEKLLFFVVSASLDTEVIIRPFCVTG